MASCCLPLALKAFQNGEMGGGGGGGGGGRGMLLNDLP